MILFHLYDPFCYGKLTASNLGQLRPFEGFHFRERILRFKDFKVATLSNRLFSQNSQQPKESPKYTPEI